MQMKIAETDIRLDPAALAAMGNGEIAYVKRIASDDVNRLFPGVPEIEPGIPLFALLAADGKPIMLTDDRDVALAGARENNLVTVSLH